MRRRNRQRAAAVSSLAIPALLALYAYRKRIVESLQTAGRTPHATPLNTPALEGFQNDLFIEKPNGQRELLVPDLARGRVSRVLLYNTKPSTFALHRMFFDRPDDVNVKKVGVNRNFLKQLRALLRIIIPRATSKEVLLFVLHTCFLVFRTYLSLLVAKLDGRIVRALVTANGKDFLTGLLLWYGLALPSTYTNSMIRFLQQKLASNFRTRLTRYTHDLFLTSNNYYKVLNLDSRIEGVDQFITTDIAHFCETLSSLYSNLSKPILDMLLFNVQLARSIGGKGTIGVFASYIATGWILRRVTPAFGKLAAVEAKLEGDFRAAHSRVITNAEEIAFYDGERLEKDILQRSYLTLIRHINGILKMRISYAMIEDFTVKYAWSAAGYCLISLPVFFGLTPLELKQENDKVAHRTEAYISNRRLLLSLADAGGRLFSTNKELAELAGYTSRVFSLLAVLHQLNNNQYQSVSRPAELSPAEPFYDLGAINGAVVEQMSGGVEFRNVPVVAPAPGLLRGGEELVKALTFTVGDGQHILISGPNGVGKTSVARILAGLWPCFEGVVRRPERQDILFLPQRPYLSLGSLRDQLVFWLAREELRNLKPDSNCLLEQNYLPPLLSAIQKLRWDRQ